MGHGGREKSCLILALQRVWALFKWQTLAEETEMREMGRHCSQCLFSDKYSFLWAPFVLTGPLGRDRVPLPGLVERWLHFPRRVTSNRNVLSAHSSNTQVQQTLLCQSCASHLTLGEASTIQGNSICSLVHSALGSEKAKRHPGQTSCKPLQVHEKKVLLWLEAVSYQAEPQLQKKYLFINVVPEMLSLMSSDSGCFPPDIKLCFCLVLVLECGADSTLQ